MSDSIIGLCEFELYLPGITSLKEKRGIVKSLTTRLRNQFNISAAEVAHQDKWQSAKIAIVTVSNSTPHVQKRIQNVIHWVEENFPHVYITRHEVEIL